MTSLKSRTENLVAVMKKAPDSIQPYLIKAAPFIAMLIHAMQISLPYFHKAYSLGLLGWKKLQPYHPEDLLGMVVGLGMAFFGGVFPAFITAVEAYRQIGWEPTAKAFKSLYADFSKVLEASEKDDKVDADKDGVADVKLIGPEELIQRKTLLFLRTSDPTTCTEAMTAISSGWLAVLASLKLSFARAIMLGSAIGDVLRKPALRYLAPVCKTMVPEEYHKWIVPVITYACKAIAISIAWTIQRVISAFHSSLRGGQLAGKALVSYLNKYGFLSATTDDTYLDEVVGYGIAAAGFLVQMYSGFSLPFPLNIFLLPLRIGEWAIVWIIN